MKVRVESAAIGRIAKNYHRIPPRQRQHHPCAYSLSYPVTAVTVARTAYRLQIVPISSTEYRQYSVTRNICDSSQYKGTTTVQYTAPVPVHSTSVSARAPVVVAGFPCALGDDAEFDARPRRPVGPASAAVATHLHARIMQGAQCARSWLRRRHMHAYARPQGCKAQSHLCGCSLRSMRVQPVPCVREAGEQVVDAERSAARVGDDTHTPTVHLRLQAGR